MISTHKNQIGFTAVTLILAVAVLAVIGVVGLHIMNSRTQTSVSSATPASSKASVTPAPAVKSAADLGKAQAALDQNDPAATNASDSNQLNSDLSSLN